MPSMMAPLTLLLLLLLLLLAVCEEARTAKAPRSFCQPATDLDCNDLGSSLNGTGYNRFVSPLDCGYDLEEEEEDDGVTVILRLTKIYALNEESRVSMVLTFNALFLRY